MDAHTSIVHYENDVIYSSLCDKKKDK